MSRYQNWFKIYYQAQTRQFTKPRRYGELAYISIINSFWHIFEWFLSLFQISDVKPEFSSVILVPQPKLCEKNWAKMASKWAFIGGGFKSPP